MELGGDPLESDPYAGYVIEDSDLEYSDCSEGSSDDELSQVKTKSIGERLQTRSELGQDDDGSSDDDFEKEMEAEAARLLASKAHSSSLSSRGLEEPSTASNGSQILDVPTLDEKESKKEEYYDAIYFDSSSDEEDTEDVLPGESRDIVKKKKTKVRKLTNDELFYDPNMDEDDERWVQRQRLAYHNVRVSEELQKKQKQKSSTEEQPTSEDTAQKVDVPQSDAVLNCPACLSTLCLDCQRHEFYTNQYRAMFVLNCKIIKDEILHYKPKPQQGRKGKRRSQDGSKDRGETEEDYHPVRCNICNTEVGVYDKEEVIHFFNVLSSPP